MINYDKLGKQILAARDAHKKRGHLVKKAKAKAAKLRRRGIRTQRPKSVSNEVLLENSKQFDSLADWLEAGRG